MKKKGKTIHTLLIIFFCQLFLFSLAAIIFTSSATVLFSALACLIYVIIEFFIKWKKEYSQILGYSQRYYSEMADSEAQEELRFSKSTQWNVIYYIVALMAAILGIPSIVKSEGLLHIKINIILLSLGLIIYIYGFRTILTLTIALRNARLGITRLPSYKKRFRTYDDYKDQRSRDVSYFRDIEYGLPFLAIITVMLLLIMYRVWPEFHAKITCLLVNFDYKSWPTFKVLFHIL